MRFPQWVKHLLLKRGIRKFAHTLHISAKGGSAVLECADSAVAIRVETDLLYPDQDLTVDTVVVAEDVRQALAASKKDLEAEFNDVRMTLHGLGASFTVSKADGQFPDILSVVPKGEPKAKIVVDPAKLKDLAARLEGLLPGENITLSIYGTEKPLVITGGNNGKKVLALLSHIDPEYA